MATMVGENRKTTTYTHDTDLGELDSVKDPNGNLTGYTYDADNSNLTGVTQPSAAGTMSASYTYDNDRIKSIAHTGGSGSTTYNFTYGTGGLLSNVKVGTQSLVTNTYNARYLLSKALYGNSDYWNYTYDSQDRISSRSDESGNSFTYTYNSEGNLSRIIDADGNVTQHFYDLSGRLSRVTTENGVYQSYTWDYDNNDNIEKVYDTVGATRYTTAYKYDKDNRPEKTYYNNGSDQNAHDVIYDDYGRVTSITGTWKDASAGTTTAKLTTTYTYISPSSTSTYTTRLPATITNTPQSGAAKTLTYTYDDNGNIASVSDGTNTTTYVYDTANQLKRENNQAAGKTWTYNYDIGGNLVGKWEYDYTTASVSVSDKLASWAYTYGDTTWRDKLTKYAGTTITSDALGNVLSDGTWSYTWEGGRQLSGMSKTGTTLSFDYNESDLRTAKTVGSTTTYYTYIGSQLSSETTGGNTIYFHYDANGSPMGFRYNGALYMYAKNIQGDIIGIVNEAGSMVVEYTYDAWGNPLSTTGTAASTIGAANPLRYRGYYYDEESGLYYLQSRYYNPTWGRFINADGWTQTTTDSIGANMFAYCGNNPVMYSDLSGRWWQSIVDGIEDAFIWVNDNIFKPIGQFFSDIGEDIRNYDSNNNSEQKVFDSNYFSCYKGAFVIKTPFDSSFSFGIIGLSSQQQNADTLRHEYGHIIQWRNKGFFNYTFDVAIPSVTINILERQNKLPYNYYSYPWEAEANMLGGSSLWQYGIPALPPGGYTSYWDLVVLFFE